jgi:hypothetical protein
VVISEEKTVVRVTQMPQIINITISAAKVPLSLFLSLSFSLSLSLSLFLSLSFSLSPPFSARSIIISQEKALAGSSLTDTRDDPCDSSIDSEAVPVVDEHLANDDEAPDTRKPIHGSTQCDDDEKGCLGHRCAQVKKFVGPEGEGLGDLHPDQESPVEAGCCFLRVETESLE